MLSLYPSYLNQFFKSTRTSKLHRR